VGSTATIVTTGSIQEIAKYNIYNLYICAIGNIVSRLMHPTYVQKLASRQSRSPPTTNREEKLHTLTEWK